MKKILAFMCAKKVEAEPKTERSNSNKSPAKSLVRRETRQTLSLNDAFIKLSRKNVVEEEFSTSEILNYQLERHISSRIKGMGIGIVKGEFSQEITQAMQYCVHLEPKPIASLPYRNQIQTNDCIRIRPDCVDIFMMQTCATYSGNNKKVSQVGKPSSAMERDQIERFLNAYASVISNMMIVCSRNMQQEALNDMMNPYAKHYLIEIENVRQNQDLVCNIIYLSKQAAFLRINDKSLKEQIISAMNLNMEEEAKMNKILTRLLEEQCHLRVVTIVRKLAKEAFGKKSLFERFIIEGRQDSQKMREVLDSMKSIIYHEHIELGTPTLNEPTPDFIGHVSIHKDS